MRKTEVYNNVSKILSDKIKLKPGETVIYKLCNLDKDPYNPGKYLIPFIKAVPAVDQIWDEESGEYIPIAAVKSVNTNGEHIFHPIHFQKSSSGYIVLNGGRAADQEVHAYMSLCNYNASNPNRDQSVEAIFELVDESKKSENERRTRNIRREALNIAADLTADEVRTYIASLGLDENQKLEILRNTLEEMADNDPQNFLDLVNNKQAIMKATINRALSKGIINFNSEKSSFTWPNGEIILVVARTTDGDHIEELVGYCVSNAKGEKVYQTIQSKSKK